MSISLAVFFGGSLAVGAVSLVAPLDSWEAPSQSRPQAQVPADVAGDNGLGYCRRQLTGVDCGCFAQKAAQILSDNRERVTGWAYADKWELARSQASAACS